MKMRDASPLENAELQDIRKRLSGALEKTVVELTEIAWSRRQLSFLGSLVTRLREANIGLGVTEVGAPSTDLIAVSWIGIESLSRLRKLVGGRFENIKKKWVDAGFPLKEHRGDSSGAYLLDQEGWLALSNWLLKHGYEARLLDGAVEYLFEIRPISSPR